MMRISIHIHLGVAKPFPVHALEQDGHGSEIFNFYFVFEINHSPMNHEELP